MPRPDVGVMVRSIMRYVSRGEAVGETAARAPSDGVGPTPDFLPMRQLRIVTVIKPDTAITISDDGLILITCGGCGNQWRYRGSTRRTQCRECDTRARQAGGRAPGIYVPAGILSEAADRKASRPTPTIARGVTASPSAAPIPPPPEPLKRTMSGARTHASRPANQGPVLPVMQLLQMGVEGLARSKRLARAPQEPVRASSVAPTGLARGAPAPARRVVPGSPCPKCGTGTSQCTLGGCPMPIYG